MKEKNIFPSKFISLHQGEESVRVENLNYIKSSEDLLLHTIMIEKSMDLINHFYWHYEDEDEEQKII